LDVSAILRDERHNDLAARCKSRRWKRNIAGMAHKLDAETRPKFSRL
jgi:hypothetical protein